MTTTIRNKYMVVFFAAASDGIVNEKLIGKPFIFAKLHDYNNLK